MKTINETQHEELLTFLNPLVDFMSQNGYSFMMVAGKDGLCSRTLMGDFHDVTGMLIDMAEKNRQVEGIVEYVAEHLKARKPTQDLHPSR